MKIMDVPKGSRVKVSDTDEVRIPPEAIEVKGGDELLVGYLDGMYVNATNASGERVYVAAWTEVEFAY